MRPFGGRRLWRPQLLFRHGPVVSHVRCVSIFFRQVEGGTPLVYHDKPVMSPADDVMMPPVSKEMLFKYGPIAKYADPALANSFQGKKGSLDELQLNTYPDGCSAALIDLQYNNMAAWHGGLYSDEDFAINVLTPEETRPCVEEDDWAEMLEELLVCSFVGFLLVLLTYAAQYTGVTSCLRRKLLHLAD